MSASTAEAPEPRNSDSEETKSRSESGTGQNVKRVRVELQCCPVCSFLPLNPDHPPRLETPQWYFAKRTSENRGVRCAFLVGCDHVTKLFGCRLVETPNANTAAEEWNAEAARLLAEKVRRWSDGQQAQLKSRFKF